MWRAVLFLVVVIGAAQLSAAETANPAARTDAEGVPLPPEAIARLGSSRFWHNGYIQVLRFSRDGRTLFTGTASRDAIYAWDVATGRLLWRKEFGNQGDNDAKFGRSLSPSDIGFIDASVAILLADENKQEFVVRFDRTTGREVSRVRLMGQFKPERYRFSPDGSKVALSQESDLAVYETAAGRRLFSQRLENKIRQLDVFDFSPGGNTVAVGDDTGGVHLMRADNGRPIRKASTVGSMRGLRFAPHGDSIVIQPEFFPVLLLDAATGAIRHRLEPAGAYHLHSVVAMPDGKQLLTGGRVFLEGMVRQVSVIAWDLATGKELRRFDYAGQDHGPQPQC